MNHPIPDETTFSRRSALARLAGSAAGLAALGTLPAPAVASAASQAPLKGRVRHSVCRWCYGGIGLEPLCEAGKQMGLQSVELLEVKDFPVLQKHGLSCAMVSGVPGGIGSGLNRVEHHDRIVAFFEQTAPIVAKHGYKNIIVFSGNRAGMSDEQGIENCARGIQRLVPICERHGVTAVMELLNSRVDHADYMCDRTEWGVRLCETVGSDRFKLLYDIYHMQIMEGDVIATIRRHHRWIAHYHTGGVPGRNEIDESQELYYPAIMRAIVDTGYTGFVGQELIPKRSDPLASLRQGVLICDV
jgi:hydroxypyruvate isomerase